MKRKAPDAREEACVLCRRADSDQDKYGEKRRKDGLCAHENCLYLASGLPVRRTSETGADEFFAADIRQAVKRATRQLCYICGERGATIRCRQKGCKRSFHFPCGCEDGCISQFFGQYRSFCREHRPAQTVQAHWDGETSCLICLEPVEEQLSYHALVCPACRHAWFHRGCIQQQALRAGFFCFQCPQCKDRETFLWEMSSMGIRVPVREAAWEADGAFDQLYERHSRCDASRCLYTRGREEAEDEGPWHLLLCCSCAAKGTHRRCSALRATADTWECDDCAGLGTSSSTQSETTSSSTSSQAASTPSCPAPASSSRPGQTRPHRRPGRSRLQRRSPTSATGQAASASSSRAPVSSSHPGHARPHRRPGRSRLQRRSPTPATGQAASASSSRAPASSSRPGQTGPHRRPGRSRLQRRSPNPYSRP